MRQILFIIICLLCSNLFAQKLRVKQMIALPMDLSASQYERKADDGQACALVKLLMVGDIDGVEGAAVGLVESRGTEKWIYMEPGARMLGVIPTGGQPVIVCFAEFGVQQLESKATYELTIVADNRIAKTFNVGDISFDMIKVEGGMFMMGVPKELEMNNTSVGFGISRPQHRVTLSAFWIGETEVTQALWKVVMDDMPLDWKGDDYPMEGATWDECQEFLKKLNVLTGMQFRLPTEAEWEFAARGGKFSEEYKYSGSNDVSAVAWFYNQENDRNMHSVKGKKPNELWLYDMSGNVAERCSDWWSSYKMYPQTNPQQASKDSKQDSHVVRGGGFTSIYMADQSDCLVYARSWIQKKYEKAKDRNLWLKGLGMRLVLADN